MVWGAHTPCPPPSARLPSHSPIHQLVIWLRRNDGTLRKQAENWPDGKLTLVVWKQCLMDPRVGFSKKDVAVVMKNTQVDKIDGESWVDYKPIVEISVDILTKRLSSKMACGGKQRREREKEGRVGRGGGRRLAEEKRSGTDGRKMAFFSRRKLPAVATLIFAIKDSLE